MCGNRKGSPHRHTAVAQRPEHVLVIHPPLTVPQNTRHTSHRSYRTHSTHTAHTSHRTHTTHNH